MNTAFYIVSEINANVNLVGLLKADNGETMKFLNYGCL